MIYVVMPVLLQEYAGGASSREDKFRRAVQSFLDQSYADSELIIVADGCQRTLEIAKEFSALTSNIVCLFHDRETDRPYFAGAVRNVGLAEVRARSKSLASDLICYLDSDDIFLSGHLKFIGERFSEENNLDWAYYNDQIARDAALSVKQMRGVHYFPGCIGTSSIVHKACLYVWWEDGYGHDFKFVAQLARNSNRHKHIGTGRYLVCHIPNLSDY